MCTQAGTGEDAQQQNLSPLGDLYIYFMLFILHAVSFL